MSDSSADDLVLEHETDRLQKTITDAVKVYCEKVGVESSFGIAAALKTYFTWLSSLGFDKNFIKDLIDGLEDDEEASFVKDKAIAIQIIFEHDKKIFPIIIGIVGELWYVRSVEVDKDLNIIKCAAKGFAVDGIPSDAHPLSILTSKLFSQICSYYNLPNVHFGQIIVQRSSNRPIYYVVEEGCPSNDSEAIWLTFRKDLNPRFLKISDVSLLEKVVPGTKSLFDMSLSS